MRNIHLISTKMINWKIISEMLEQESILELSDESRKKITQCRNYLNDRLERTSDSLYGINTGFGSLYNKVISKDDLGLLQKTW